MRRDVVMTVRFTEEEADQLRRAAARSGMSISEYIRRCSTMLPPNERDVGFMSWTGGEPAMGTEYSYE